MDGANQTRIKSCTADAIEPSGVSGVSGGLRSRLFLMCLAGLIGIVKLTRLSFNENVNLLLAKFPEAFRVDAYYNQVKQIVFIAPLIEKILRGEVQCTYRTTPKHGYYYVIHSHFVKAHLKKP